MMTQTMAVLSKKAREGVELLDGVVVVHGVRYAVSIKLLKLVSVFSSKDVWPEGG